MGYVPLPPLGVRSWRGQARAILREERRPTDLAGWVAWLVFLPYAWLLPWRRRRDRERLAEIEKACRERDDLRRLDPPQGGSGVPPRAGEWLVLATPAAPYGTMRA